MAHFHSAQSLKGLTALKNLSSTERSASDDAGGRGGQRTLKPCKEAVRRQEDGIQPSSAHSEN